MKVSVVIAAYNAERTIAECLAGCLGQTRPAHEIIVVDDGSTDRTKAVVLKAAGTGHDDRTDPTDPTDGRAQADEIPVPVRYLYQSNAGPAAARNLGAAAATGDLIAFTDSDCVPEEGWLEALAAGFTDEHIAGVGGTYAIANPEAYLARLIHEEIGLRHARMEGEVDFLGSFNVAYRRSAFDAVGGFDASFRAASGEDNDLAYRIADHGGKLFFTRGAVVAHYHPTRLGRYLRTQYGHGYWRVKLYTKLAGRIAGDRYAGRGDFLAPPLSLALLGSAMVGLLLPSPLVPFMRVFSGALLLVYLALQGWKGVRMARRAGLRALVLFPMLLFLRDVARGLGLLHGLWHFGVLRRGRK